MTSSLPALPARVAAITINNAPRRNALSLAALRDLRTQLVRANTSPQTGRLLLLPLFKPSMLSTLEATADKLAQGQNSSSSSSSTASNAEDYSWLVSSRAYAHARAGLPNVLVLQSSGPVFSSGHDLSELRSLPSEQVKETFALCADIMTLIRRSPALVIGRIHGLATAAGAQLALTTDIPVAVRGTPFRLPGAVQGLPCTSPSTAVSRRMSNSLAFRLMALAEPWEAEQMGGAVRVVGADDGSLAKASAEDKVRLLDEEVVRVAGSLAGMPAQPAALGKWAFWAQASFKGQEGEMGGGSGGDGYEDAVVWAGRMMALYAKSSEDAREGMTAFMEKRKPVWISNGEQAQQGDRSQQRQATGSKL